MLGMPFPIKRPRMEPNAFRTLHFAKYNLHVRVVSQQSRFKWLEQQLQRCWLNPENDDLMQKEAARNQRSTDSIASTSDLGECAPPPLSDPDTDVDPESPLRKENATPNIPYSPSSSSRIPSPRASFCIEGHQEDSLGFETCQDDDDAVANSKRARLSESNAGSDDISPPCDWSFKAARLLDTIDEHHELLKICEDAIPLLDSVEEVAAKEREMESTIREAQELYLKGKKFVAKYRKALELLND